MLRTVCSSPFRSTFRPSAFALHGSLGACYNNTQSHSPSRNHTNSEKRTTRKAPSSSEEASLDEKSRTFGSVSVSRYPGVGNVTVVRLDQTSVTMNALSSPMLSDLTNVLLDLNRDPVPAYYPKTDAIILTSSGATAPQPPVFSVGIDFSSTLRPRATKESVVQLWRQLQNLWILLNTHRLPLIGAANGGAIGFGYMLLLACDTRLGLEHDDAVFSVNHATHGLVMPPWYMGHLAYLLGCRRAERLCLSGTALSAQEALKEGLLDSVYANEAALLAAAHREAHRALSIAPFAYLRVKGMMRRDLQQYLATEEDARYDAAFFSDFILSNQTQGILRSSLQPNHSS